MTDIPDRTLLAPAEAASLLGVAHRSLTCAKWRRLRGIPTYKLGPRLLRFDRAELEAWLLRHRET